MTQPDRPHTTSQRGGHVDPIIILIGRSMMNVGRYIIDEIKLNLRKGDNYLNDKMPIWFSNTRYYREKRIIDNALKSVSKYTVSRSRDISDWKGTDHTPLDLGYGTSDVTSNKMNEVNE